MDGLTTNEEAALLISSLSLVASAVGVAIAARANAKANAISRQANEIALLQARDTSHGRLVEALSSVELRLEAPLKGLSEIAGSSLTAVTNLIGEYEGVGLNRKAPRHIYYDCCKAVSSALSGQIAQQTSESLHWRLDAVWRADDVLVEGWSVKSVLEYAMYGGPVRKRRGLFRLLGPKPLVDAAELEDELRDFRNNISREDAMLLFVRGASCAVSTPSAWNGSSRS
jgi:hypothetical protein